MKLLIKTTLILAVLFASTFLMIKFTGLLTVEDIKLSFQTIKEQHGFIIGLLVATLLFADLFIAIPTMTVIILAGYFLGFPYAVIFVFTGLAAAALTGYLISFYWGDLLLRKIDREEKQHKQMQQIFNEHGILILILSRAAPILPEVSACLAGMSKMPFQRFLLGWSLSSIPYMLIVSYAGSISELNNPTPAIVVAIIITSVLWLSWFLFLRVKVREEL